MCVCACLCVCVCVCMCVCEWERVSLPSCLRSCVRMCVNKLSLPSLIVISGLGENQFTCCLESDW